MTTFTAAFQELVIPDLRRACRLHALSVARGRCSFSDAHDAVWRHARDRGALYLPKMYIQDEWVEGFDEINEWISSTLLRTIDDIENREDAAREIVDEALGPLEASWRTTTK